MTPTRSIVAVGCLETKGFDGRRPRRSLEAGSHWSDCDHQKARSNPTENECLRTRMKECCRAARAGMTTRPSNESSYIARNKSKKQRHKLTAHPAAQFTFTPEPIHSQPRYANSKIMTDPLSIARKTLPQMSSTCNAQIRPWVFTTAGNGISTIGGP